MVANNTSTSTLFVDLKGLSSKAAAQVKATLKAGTAGFSKKIIFLD